MKKQNSLSGYLLIGLGLYFLLRQLNIPFLSQYYSWPTILFIIGFAFLLHSYMARDHANILPGAVLLGLGIHFHGLSQYEHWIDHWSIYPIIVGLSFLLRYFKTKSGLIPALTLLGISAFAFFQSSNTGWFSFIYQMISWTEQFWPLVLIVVGLFILKKRS